MKHDHSLHVHRATRVDPTRTTGLRKRFEREMRRRFADLAALIRQAVVDRDVFGLNLKTNQLPATGQFQFLTSGEKVSSFMQWLKDEEDRGLLSITPGTPLRQAANNAWTNTYIQSSYQAGLVTAGAQLRKAGVTVEPSWLESAFWRPIHADRAGLIYTRVFEDLTGITNAMDTSISRVLARGLLEGRSPLTIANDIVDRVEGIGLTRARTLARTEVIAAHAEASLNAYEEAGLEGVTVQAEWLTAGDERVCPDCEDMAGKTFPISEAHGMIPLHPNCRCVFIPVVDDVPQRLRLS